jgi:hypothetical protein
VRVADLCVCELKRRELKRPLLWIESGERSDSEEEKGREELLSGLKAGGALLAIKHSLHMSFSDEPSYMTSLGRHLGRPRGDGKALASDY